METFWTKSEVIKKTIKGKCDTKGPIFPDSELETLGCRESRSSINIFLFCY